ncbi:MAG: class II aldolase/adducin family protein [Thermoplasmata archaeon]
MPSNYEIKKRLCFIGKTAYERGYIAGSEGNFSVLTYEKHLLITPSGLSKGFLEPDDIVETDMDGNLVRYGSKSLRASLKPSSEIKMHLVAYKKRNDIAAAVHAHPPYATAFALAGIPLTPCILPEVVVTIGAVPLAKYATPSTEEVPKSIEGIIVRCDAVLLANHGVLTVGKTIDDAFIKLETVEHLAKVYFLSLLLGNVNYLTDEEVEKLRTARLKLGIVGPWWPCSVDKK